MSGTVPLMRSRATLIREVAYHFGLDPALVAAVVEQESGGFSRATRYERNYKWVFFPDKKYDTPQEREDQMTSWGLMQVMGAVIRENFTLGRHGLDFLDPLTKALEPDRNVWIGCSFLAGLFAKCGQVTTDALACYNGGYKNSPGGRTYAAHVLERIPRLRRDLFPDLVTEEDGGDA